MKTICFFLEDFGEKILDLALVNNKSVFTCFFEEGYMGIWKAFQRYVTNNWVKLMSSICSARTAA